MSDERLVYYGENGSRKPWRLIISLTAVAIVLVGGLYFFLLRPDEPSSENVQRPESSTSEQPEDPLEVALQGLSNGQVITENTTIQVDVGNDARAGRVEFYIDGVFAGVTYAPPFQFVLDIDKLSSGA